MLRTGRAGAAPLLRLCYRADDPMRGAHCVVVSACALCSGVSHGLFSECTRAVGALGGRSSSRAGDGNQSGFGCLTNTPTRRTAKAGAALCHHDVVATSAPLRSGICTACRPTWTMRSAELRRAQLLCGRHCPGTGSRIGTLFKAGPGVRNKLCQGVATPSATTLNYSASHLLRAWLRCPPEPDHPGAAGALEEGREPQVRPGSIFPPCSPSPISAPMRCVHCISLPADMAAARMSPSLAVLSKMRANSPPDRQVHSLASAIAKPSGTHEGRTSSRHCCSGVSLFTLASHYGPVLREKVGCTPNKKRIVVSG